MQEIFRKSARFSDCNCASARTTAKILTVSDHAKRLQYQHLPAFRLSAFATPVSATVPLDVSKNDPVVIEQLCADSAQPPNSVPHTDVIPTSFHLPNLAQGAGSGF